MCVFVYILVKCLCIFISRPGRRPLGFLSLICPKNSLDSDEAAQTHSKKRLKPHIPALRRNLKKPNLLNTSQKKSEESSSDPLPSPSITDPQSDDTGKSAAQVCVWFFFFFFYHATIFCCCCIVKKKKELLYFICHLN